MYVPRKGTFPPPSTQGKSQARPKHINLRMDGRHSAHWYNHGHPPISPPGARSWPRLRLAAQVDVVDGVLVRSSSPVTRLSFLTPPPQNPSRLELPGFGLQTLSLLTPSMVFSPSWVSSSQAHFQPRHRASPPCLPRCLLGMSNLSEKKLRLPHTCSRLDFPQVCGPSTKQLSRIPLALASTSQAGRPVDTPFKTPPEWILSPSSPAQPGPSPHPR